MGTIANAKVTHYYNCYNGDFIGCLLFNLYPAAKIKEKLPLQKTVCYHLVVHLLHSTIFVGEGYKKDVPEQLPAHPLHAI